nr:C39 family peptidase [uncultured Acetatifactor sp.]
MRTETMNRAQYRRVQEQKRRKAIRRRRIRRIRMGCRMVFAVVLAGICIKLLGVLGLFQAAEEILPFFAGKEDEEINAILEDASAYPPELLEALQRNPELLEFVKGYPESDGRVAGGLSQEELSEEFPLLLQYDGRWGYASFGDDNIALSGCAPACLSMVAVALTGNSEVSPDVVADYAMDQGYYQAGVGTMWSLMTQGAEAFGVQGREINLDRNVVFSELEAGHPIICSMRPGDFTTTGHFIVLTKAQDGMISVNDPFSRERSSRLWDYETLEYQIKNLWSFTAL